MKMTYTGLVYLWPLLKENMLQIDNFKNRVLALTQLTFRQILDMLLSMWTF